MRIATVQIYQRGLDSMLDQQARVFKTQLQLSTNQRFSSPGEDPTAAAQVLGLNESLAITQQYRDNATAARARLDLEDSTLQGVNDALQRARELAIQANNDTLSASDRRGLAQELRQIVDQVMGMANTRDASGEHIFAGFQTRAVPFSHDGSGTFTYNGDQGQRKLQVGPARQIAISDSGMDVFMKVRDVAGTGYQDIFSTLYTMATELEADTANPARLTEIDNAMDNILQTQARIGARLNALDREEQANETYSLQLQATRSEIRDIDIAESATQLNQQLLVLQSAQQAFVRVQNLSLFNYL